MSATIPVTPVVPIDPRVTAWTRFIGTYEAQEFTGWIDESVSWKTDCYIGDWSPLLKIRVRGPEAKAFFEYISTNRWPNFAPGEAKHAIFCQDNGQVVGEGLILMLAEDDFMFTSVPGVTWALFQFYHGRRKFSATMENVSDQWYLFQVQGPKSVALLEEVTGASIRDIDYIHAKEMTIDGCKFWCLRQGVSGELGFELWGPTAEGQKVYDTVRKIGAEKYGLRQLGGRAKAVNHVEAGFLTPALDFIPAIFGETEQLKGYRDFLKNAGLEFVGRVFARAKGNYGEGIAGHHRTPYDLGWGWLVKFDHDFIGKEALQEVARNPPNKLVTLVWNKEDVTDVFASLFTPEPFEYMEIPRTPGGLVEGCSVYADGDNLIGCAVSRCYSYWFKETISFGFIKKEHAAIGSQVHIRWGSPGSRQKLIRATVQKCPYKEDRRKTPLQ